MSNPKSFTDELFGLHGKTVVITGAGGGIGTAYAVAMAKAGATIGVHDIGLEQAGKTVAAVEAAGGKAIALEADLRDVEACKRLIADAKAKLGRIDVLINNAGMNRRKPIDEVTLDDYDTITAVNQRSIYFLCQAVHPVMKAQGGGKIINIGSMTTFIGLGGVSVYGVTKAAVSQFTKTCAVEWAKDNIQVNCLAPGYVITPLTEQSLWGDAYKREWLLSRIPMKRGAQPDDMVGTALFLASNASNYVTGQTIAVDGGSLAGGSWDKDE